MTHQPHSLETYQLLREMFTTPLFAQTFPMFFFRKTVFIVGKYLSNKTAEKDMLQFFFISFRESLIILRNNSQQLRFISRAKFKPHLTGCLENILFCCLWALIKMCSIPVLFSLAPPAPPPQPCCVTDRRSDTFRRSGP